jgi:Cyclin, N-terminal domain/Cyclin, C-terminal domain
MLLSLTFFQERCLPAAEMMDLQPELEWYMLPFLVDFMIEVHSQFRMSPATLHLALNLINRYVSRRIVFKKHYQLVGCAALWIAAKFEDAKDKVPTVRELRNMCVNAYEDDMFVQMEGHVLSTLNWEIGSVQTCEAFAEHQISRLRGQHGHVDCRLIHLTRFFLDLSLFAREFLAFKPSQVASASVALSRHIVGSQQFMQHRHSEEEIDCVELLLTKMSSASAILRRKYTNKLVHNVTSVVDEFLAQAARKEFQQSTPPSSARSECPSPRLSEVKTPDLHIQLPDTPPHTPITTATVPLIKKPSYFVNGAGLPTPPADDDNKKVHILPNEFTRGTYGRSESFISDSRHEQVIEPQEEDMDTEYGSEDEEMTYSDEEDLDYEFESEEEDDEVMMMDHRPIPPRIVLAPVV